MQLSYLHISHSYRECNYPFTSNAYALPPKQLNCLNYHRFPVVRTFEHSLMAGSILRSYMSPQGGPPTRANYSGKYTWEYVTVQAHGPRSSTRDGKCDFIYQKLWTRGGMSVEIKIFCSLVLGLCWVLLDLAPSQRASPGGSWRSNQHRTRQTVVWQWTGQPIA